MKELKRGEESVLGEHFEDTGSFEKTIDFKRFSKGLRSIGAISLRPGVSDTFG